MDEIKKKFAILAAVITLCAGSVAAENSLSVYTTATMAAAPAAYIFEVVFDSPVTAASHFEIIFPPEYNLKNVVMASSDRLDGSLQVTSQENTLIISRRDAEKTVPAGQTIDLKIAAVLNPAESSGNNKLTVVLKQNQTEIERAESRTAAKVFQTNNR